MLLFLLCAGAGVKADGLSIPKPTPFTDPSAVLLNPAVAGEVNDMGLAAVSPVRGAFAAAVSIRGAARASPPRASVGIGASVGLLWLATLVDEGLVKSVSVFAVVDVDRVLEDDGNPGAENRLDTVDWADSCEFGGSVLDTVAVSAV
jgi:hypothetical protein